MHEFIEKVIQHRSQKMKISKHWLFKQKFEVFAEKCELMDRPTVTIVFLLNFTEFLGYFFVDNTRSFLLRNVQLGLKPELTTVYNYNLLAKLEIWQLLLLLPTI